MDSIVGVVLVVVMLVAEYPVIPTVGLGILAVATVIWRRRWPRATTAAVMAAAAGFLHAEPSAGIALVSVAVVLDFYSLGRAAARTWWRSWETLLGVAALPVIASGPGTWDAPTVLSVWAFFVIVPFTAGRVMDSRSRLTSQLAEDADRLLIAQQRREQRATAEERMRVAREVHDVLAHNVSVMVIQTAAARRVARTDVGAAQSALSVVESCGREALADLRRIVGVVRRDDPSREAWAPGLRQLPSLVQRAQTAGLPVELHVVGVLRWVPAAVDLAAYRIAQEALTNCLRHGRGSQTHVTVTYLVSSLRLEIINDGHRRGSAFPNRDGSGQGLVGMRERAESCGGLLEAGPLPGRGFRVVTILPFGDAVGGRR